MSALSLPYLIALILIIGIGILSASINLIIPFFARHTNQTNGAVKNKRAHNCKE